MGFSSFPIKKLPFVIIFKRIQVFPPIKAFFLVHVCMMFLS